jgi:hypothetical protein
MSCRVRGCGRVASASADGALAPGSSFAMVPAFRCIPLSTHRPVPATTPSSKAAAQGASQEATGRAYTHAVLSCIEIQRSDVLQQVPAAARGAEQRRGPGEMRGPFSALAAPRAPRLTRL